MIRTVSVDDKTVAGKYLIKDFTRVSKGIKFENSANENDLPEGYISGDEFESNLVRRITAFYKNNGLL